MYRILRLQVLQSETNELFAMKKVKLSNVDESVAMDYLNEVALLQNLQNCDIIVKIHDQYVSTASFSNSLQSFILTFPRFPSEYVCNDGKKVLYLVMEKGQADLSASIREISQQSADACMLTILSYWCQMLRAVNEIHKRSTY